MATSLAGQLAQIAAKSKSILDVKTQKAGHSKSLLFEPRVAATQTFPTIYATCFEGFEELCRLDGRFGVYGFTLFSEQSQHEDRMQLTAGENAELDKKIESFVRLVAGRLRLMPAVKSLEWLVRRFRIHEFNTAALLTAFLPYYTMPIFMNLLAILPAKLPSQFTFLSPYVRAGTPPPRTVIVHQATRSADFLSHLSTYTFEACRSQAHYPALISFWGSLLTEAVSGMLDQLRSGRKGVQAENDQRVLLQLVPILSEGLVLGRAPDAQVATYMAVAVYAAKGDLTDEVLAAFMEQLAQAWSPQTVRPGLICLAMLAQRRASKQLPWKVARAMLKVPDLPDLLAALAAEHRVDRLANGLCLAALDRLYKKGDTRGLDAIQAIFLGGILADKQMENVFKSLLLAAYRLNGEVDDDGSARRQLGTAIVKLSRTSGNARSAVEKALADADVDVDEIEMKLEAKIRPKTLAQPAEADKNDKMDEVSAQEDVETALARISAGHAERPTCMSASATSLFDDLRQLFVSIALDGAARDAFDRAPILAGDAAADKSFYLSFHARLWCGPYPSFARGAAMDAVSRRLKDPRTRADAADFQALYPYCVAALADASKRVRRAAAELVAVLASLWGDAASKAQKQRALVGLYEVDDVDKWPSQDLSARFLTTVLASSLEECVLHEDHVGAVIQRLLEGGSKSTERLPQAALTATLLYLANHAIATPLLTVKSRLLRPLNHIKAIGGTTRTQALLPVLRWWSALSADEAEELCRREEMEAEALNAQFVEIVAANDKSGLEFLLAMAKFPALQARRDLLRAVFARLKSLWPAIKTETRISLAMDLFELSQSQDKAVGVAAEEAAGFVRMVELPTSVLSSFLRSIKDVAANALDATPNKRRRTSSENGNGTRAGEPDLTPALGRATFVLELIDGSNPVQHPQLLNDLFSTLAELQHLRTVMGSELGYLQNLVLGSLLAMMPAYQNNKALKMDASAGQGDLLVNCIQKSSSPSVQNAALLLVASLASTAPDLVLHSVMPIFAFMGGSVLRQNDDYSAHVINQTIKEVIPPLIASLRRGKRNPVTGASELLLSFVAAYEHVPSHRRQALFKSLVETLGAEEFMFAVLAMLVDKYTFSEVESFAVGLLGSFGVDVQLQTAVKVLDLVGDMLKPKPTISTALLGTQHDGGFDAQSMARDQLAMLARVLRSRSLAFKMAEVTSHDDMEAARVRELYADLLEGVLVMANAVKANRQLHDLCGVVLHNLLNMLSVAEFVKAVESLLDRPNMDLRHKVLRALETRIDREKHGDVAAGAVLLAFLPQLTAVIRDSADAAYKHTAITCVDKMAEKYGRRDMEAVLAAAQTIAGDGCLGQKEVRLRVISLLCLASLVDVLQDAIVPVLPEAIPRALSYLKESLGGERPNEDLHNAAYAFVTALAERIPYMISAAYLNDLMAASNASAEANLSLDANDARKQCFVFVAKQVDAKVMFTALQSNWQAAADSGYSAIREYVDVISMAIDKHPKSVVAKNIAPLAALFQSALDLRRTDAAKPSASVPAAAKRLDDIEAAVDEAALRMVYKLNDSTFRPVFAQLMDWAVVAGATSLEEEKEDVRVARALRLQGVYAFARAFFDRLKSVATSYATYVLDNAVAVLAEINSKAADDVGSPGAILPEERELAARVLATLAACFAHDQDGFWAAPAHFDAVAPRLTALLSLADAGLVAAHVTPAVVALALAVDAQPQLRAVNAGILRHLRHPDPAVRLAAVRAEQALASSSSAGATDWLTLLPEMLPYISELQEDDDEHVERETHRWIAEIEDVLGESLEGMLQ